jgi:hypothetical protein
MGERRVQLIGLSIVVITAVVIDWISETVRGLWLFAILIVVGWLFIWRTFQEMESTFAGPEHHRPWLQATGYFFIGAGLLGILLSLLALL